MESKWEDKYEYSMKEYLDELHISCNQEMPSTQQRFDNMTESQYFDLLSEKVAKAFMVSVKVALKASKKAIHTNGMSRTVDYQNYQVMFD